MSNSVNQWLEQLGLGQYAEVFAENAIDWATLPELDHELLKEIGVKAVGHRVQILKTIESLGSAPDSVSETATISGLVTSNEAERRQLTVMFCDLAGSTELSQRLDPEDLREVNRAYQDVCKASIERYDGYVARYMGDGVLAYFGYPAAHEDDAERAIHAGLSVVAGVNGIDRHDLGLSVRVGIATGAVVVGDLIGEGASQESAVVGETPNLAARLQGMAANNTVVIGPGTFELAGSRFENEDLGIHSLKGIAEPVNAWRIVAPAAVESRFEARQRAGLTPLIGREHEIGLLLERWTQAKEGDGQVILLSGEAGIGKSRITEALQERTEGDDPMRLRYQCSPHHTNSALYPVMQRLEYAARFDSEDSADSKLDKLESMIALGTADTKVVAPLFSTLLSIPSEGRYLPLDMSPEQQKAATLQALSDQLEGLSKHQPVLLIFEDAHWADPTSLELLDLMVERAQSLPVMAVITFRPEFISPWSGYSHVTALTMNRFTRSLATAMVAKVTAGKSLPEEVINQIIEKTDGVPLFVEELTKTIIESGQLSGGTIPATLHDSLMARLDRLGAVKEVAQTASAIGREFTFDLLATVSPLSFAALHDSLGQLIDAELVFRRTRSQEDAYIFKHALVQDAAYESMLMSARRKLHLRIAEALESRFPETVEAQPELLGHHYSEARIAEKAIAAWRQAAQRAMERSANLEAIAYLHKALALIQDIPDAYQRKKLELGLQTAISGPLITIKGYGAEETGRAFSRAQELSAEVGVTAELFPVMYGRWVYGLSWQRYRESIEIARQFSDLAGQQTDTGPILMGHRMTGISQFIDGRPAEGLANLEKVVSTYRREDHPSLRFKFGQDPCAAALAFWSLCLWQLGYPAQAAQKLRQSIEQAQNVDHVNTLAYVNVFGATVLHHQCANPSGLETVAASVNTLADEHGLTLWKALISIVDGWLAATIKQDPAGVDLIQQGLETTGEIFKFQRPYKLLLLAEAHSACGDSKAGLEVINEAIEMAKSVEERSFEADFHRLKGILLLHTGHPIADAEASLLESLRIARAQNAKSYELRAATSLASLWAENGKRVEANSLLSPVYDWFTEGFDTSDQQQAKTLLETLAESIKRE